MSWERYVLLSGYLGDVFRTNNKFAHMLLNKVPLENVIFLLILFITTVYCLLFFYYIYFFIIYFYYMLLFFYYNKYYFWLLFKLIFFWENWVKILSISTFEIWIKAIFWNILVVVLNNFIIYNFIDFLSRVEVKIPEIELHNRFFEI